MLHKAVKWQFMRAHWLIVSLGMLSCKAAFALQCHKRKKKHAGPICSLKKKKKKLITGKRTQSKQWSYHHLVSAATISPQISQKTQMIWLTNKWQNDTPRLIPLILGKANQPHSYLSHRQRPPKESRNQQPKPHHILTQTLERMACSDKTCLTLSSTLVSVSRAAIYTPNKTQDEARGRDTVAMIPHTKCLVILRTQDTQWAI